MKTKNRDFKDAIYEQFSRIGKAISAPKRIELLDLLCQGNKTVEIIAAQAGLTVANASQHLQILRRANLVDANRNGVFIEYHLKQPSVADFIMNLRTLSESSLAEIEQMTRAFLESKDQLEAVDRKELIARIKEGKVTLIDVRPEDEYKSGHLPKALCIPLADLKAKLSELPKNKEVVAYCRGPYCVLALEAVEILRGKGFRAVRLDMGVVDWIAAGQRVEKS